MTVDATVVSLLSVLMIECFMLAVICMTVWKISAKGEFVPFFGGLFVYLVFTTSLKGIFDLMLGGVVTANAWIYAVYTAIFWVILETLGRYLGFRSVHKERNDRRTAVSFGLGFAAAEAIATVGLSSLMYFCYAVAVNDAGMESILASLTGDDAASFQEMVTYITGLSVADCVWAMAERVVRLVLQVSLSVLVFASVRSTAHRTVLWVSAAIQFAAILPMSLYQAGLGLPMWAAEAVLFVAAASAAFYAWRVYHELPRPRTYEGRTRL